MRDIPANKAAYYLVSAREPDQAYFMIGYPIAFLAKLYEATADGAYLKAARGYLDFSLSCEGNLRSFHTSHKVAWGAAVLARITGDPRCMELAVPSLIIYLASRIPAAPGSSTSRRTPRSTKPPKLQSGCRRSAPSAHTSTKRDRSRDSHAAGHSSAMYLDLALRAALSESC